MSNRRWVGLSFLFLTVVTLPGRASSKGVAYGKPPLKFCRFAVEVHFYSILICKGWKNITCYFLPTK